VINIFDETCHDGTVAILHLLGSYAHSIRLLFGIIVLPVPFPEFPSASPCFIWRNWNRLTKLEEA
jgi:hypothetical protein